jgi:hypothetical protein
MRVVSIEVTWPIATGGTAVLDYADRQRDRQHGHDQVAAREHDETTLVQIRVSGNNRCEASIRTTPTSVSTGIVASSSRKRPSSVGRHRLGSASMTGRKYR